MARKSKKDLDAELLTRVKDRFKKSQEAEGTFRQRFADDIRFLFADPDNQEQWPANIRAERQLDGRPMLTINKTHTHWLHVVNDIKENKPSIKIRPTGGKATYEAAQVFEGVVRHIEAVSDAQTAYETAAEFQVGGGIGYWRIVTDYADENGFDQEIYIREIPNPLSVFLDPSAKKRDGSDAMYGFIFDEMGKDEFQAKFPNAPITFTGLDVQNTGGWISEDKARVAEYFEVVESMEWMYAVPYNDGSGSSFVRESEMSENQRELLRLLADDGEQVQRRKVKKRTVHWYKIAGSVIVDRGVWPGRYIPIIRVVGEEVMIDGKLDRKGLVRYMKDAQRMYNYNSSSQVEFGALQTKTPYKAPARAIKGYEQYWESANTQNMPVLPYNDMDGDGQPIAAPQREEPPRAAEAFTVGMQAATQEMMMASGQYQATFSEQSQELSGVAIGKRERQGDRATFHFPNGLARAIRFTGKQLVDLIPKVYDTERVLRIMGEDGEETTIKIDPNQAQAVQKQENPGQNAVSAIFNPNVGTYDVISKAGPSYDTRREEAFQAMKDLLIGNPALAQVIGDLWMGTADFPVADKLQERMRNWIPKDILGEGPSQQEIQLAQQLEQAQQIIQQLAQELESKQKAENLAKQEIDTRALDHLAERMESERKSQIDAFKAETDRLKALVAGITPEELAALVQKTVAEALASLPPAVPAPPSAPEAFAQGLAATDLGVPINPEPQQQPQQPQPSI